MAPAKPMERATSFAMACSLLSRYVREKGAAAGEVGLGIRGEPLSPESRGGKVGIFRTLELYMLGDKL